MAETGAGQPAAMGASSGPEAPVINDTASVGGGGAAAEGAPGFFGADARPIITPAAVGCPPPSIGVVTEVSGPSTQASATGGVVGRVTPPSAPRRQLFLTPGCSPTSSGARGRAEQLQSGVPTLGLPPFSSFGQRSPPNLLTCVLDGSLLGRGTSNAAEDHSPGASSRVSTPQLATVYKQLAAGLPGAAVADTLRPQAAADAARVARAGQAARCPIPA